MKAKEVCDSSAAPSANQANTRDSDGFPWIQIFSVVALAVVVLGTCPALLSTRCEIGPRDVSRGNVRAIVLATHNYESAYRTLPQSNGGSHGRGAGLSWRVHLLPFLERNDLYEQFNLDEPWDSETNLALVSQIPTVYQCPGSQVPVGQTVYLRPVGNGAFPQPDDTGFESECHFSDIIDGTSSTILVVEADVEESVVWTKPADYAFDPANPVRGFGGLRKGEILVGFVDGHVRFVEVDSNTLRTYFTINARDL